MINFTFIIPPQVVTDGSVDVKPTMNVCVINSLWQIVMGGKFSLDDPWLHATVDMMDRYSTH